MVFGPLAIGRSALLAQQRALAVTGANVANVNTPGYSRQRAVLTPLGGSVGGVAVRAVEQIVDPLLEARRLRTASSLAGATTGRDFADRVQGLLPVEGPSIGSALDDFFAAASDLSTHPEDVAVRTDLLARAESLAARLRTTARGIAELQREADARIVESAGEIGTLAAEIARLNRSIPAVSASGQSAHELVDQRRQALFELSARLEVRAVEQPDGTVDVFTAAGAPLVVGGEASEVAVQTTPAVGLDGSALHALGIRDAGGGVIPFYGSLGGEIGALRELRDTLLPADRAALDALATSLRDAVNAVQTDPAGRDLDGLVGGALFTGTGASDLVVAIGDPRRIAAARSASPHDNAGALALLDVRGATLAGLSGQTLGDYHASLVARIGGRARDAADLATVEESVAAAVAAQRDAVSGVSLEEEFTDLIRFQRGFEAAGQLVAVSNRMLEELMEMVR